MVSATRSELLTLGRDAERRGSIHEAIRHCTAAARIERDAAVERHLLQLRRDAACQTGTSLRTWPPVLPDPFPDVTGLPEIAVDALDSTIVGGAIVHHGAVLVRGFAPLLAAEGLRDAIDHALAAEADPQGPEAADGWYEPFVAGAADSDLAVVRALTAGLGGGLLAVDSPRAFFLLAELIDAVGFTDIVTQYLGERPVLSAKKTTFRRLRDAPRPAWHQDGSFMGDVRTVNLWISLSHCGGDTDTRGLDVIPSRVEELLATGTDDAEADLVAIGQRVVDRRVPDAMLTPEFQPGDALCFDDRFLHRTSARGGEGVRHAVEAWFFAPSHFPAQYGAIAI